MSSIEMAETTAPTQHRTPSFSAAAKADDDSDREGLTTATTTPRDDYSHHGHHGPHPHPAHNPRGSSGSDEKLGVGLLAVLVFYSVSGGPFGVEASVRSAGHFYTLLGFLLAPLVWSIPEAVLTAELSSTFPEAAGGMAWVEEAFGVEAGWMAGYLGWISGACDNAIYPVLFLDYLVQVLVHGHAGVADISAGSAAGDAADDAVAAPEDDHVLVSNPVARFAFLSCSSIALGYINWLGLPVVGRMSLGICCLAMSPFVILVVVGAFQVDPARWFIMPPPSTTDPAAADDDAGAGMFNYALLGGLAIRPWLNNLFWNFNSFDSASSFAEDVDDPGVVFPKAMFWSVIMVFLSYFLPLLVALGASDAEPYQWVDGYLSTVAMDIVGPWLGAWTVFAAGISNIGLFQAELSADAFQLMGMAERGHMPAIFAKRSCHGTPTWSIVLGTAVIVVLGAADLDQLIEMLNFNYSISLLMEYVAFIKLRMSRPELHRPWRVPLGTFGCALLFLPTFAFTLTIILLASYSTILFSIGVNAVGFLLCIARKRGVWGGVSSKTTKYYDPVDPVASEDGSVVLSAELQQINGHELS